MFAIICIEHGNQEARPLRIPMRGLILSYLGRKEQWEDNEGDTWVLNAYSASKVNEVSAVTRPVDPLPRRILDEAAAEDNARSLPWQNSVLTARISFH